MEDEEGMHVLTSTIAKVFQEAGPEICLNVKEPQIRRILQLVFEGGEIGRAELVSALHSIVVVSTSIQQLDSLGVYIRMRHLLGIRMCIMCLTQRMGNVRSFMTAFDSGKMVKHSAGMNPRS